MTIRYKIARLQESEIIVAIFNLETFFQTHCLVLSFGLNFLGKTIQRKTSKEPDQHLGSRRQCKSSGFDCELTVTVFGLNQILDYANKHWSGLFAHYYKPRWQLFLQVLYKSLRDKTPYNQSKFNEQVFEQVELKFVNEHVDFQTKARGNSWCSSHLATFFSRKLLELTQISEE